MVTYANISPKNCETQRYIWKPRRRKRRLSSSSSSLSSLPSSPPSLQPPSPPPPPPLPSPLPPSSSSSLLPSAATPPPSSLPSSLLSTLLCQCHHQRKRKTDGLGEGKGVGRKAIKTIPELPVTTMMVIWTMITKVMRMTTTITNWQTDNLMHDMFLMGYYQLQQS